VREAFEALDTGEALYLVSDRDPTLVDQFLTDLAGVEGEPTEVLPEFVVERRGPEKWVLEAVRP
jgi:ATP-binding protein involved in chromosome partitioning